MRLKRNTTTVSFVKNEDVTTSLRDNTDEKRTEDSEEEEEETGIEASTAMRLLNVLLCRCDIADQKSHVTPVPIVALFRYADNWELFLLAIGTLLSIGAGVSQPYLAVLSGKMTNSLLTVNATTSDAFYERASREASRFGQLGLVVFAVNYCQYVLFRKVCSGLTTKIKQHYIRSILRQNAAWFDANHSGVLTTKLHDNIERIHEGIGDKLGVLIRGSVTFVTGIALGFCYEWRLALMMLGVAPLCCVCMSLMNRFMSSYTAKEMAEVGHAGSIAEESLMGVRTVQAFNGQQEMVDKYEKELKKGSELARRKGFWTELLGGLLLCSLFTYFGGGLLYGGFLLRWNIIRTPGDVFTVVLSMLFGAYFLGLISPHLMALLKARVAAATIYAVIDRVPEIDAYSPDGRTIVDPIGAVRFENVHFRYASRKETKVLDGLSVSIEPGTSIAFVGHSGCGKTTSLALLTRLYEPDEGRVTIDGVDVRDVNIAWLRKTIGVVEQEPVLFNDTVLNNLMVADEAASRETVLRVCEMANAHEFIAHLPDGYETLIGDGGVQLSGGQKQRLAIARALLAEPRILLLDEATSALDAHSEALVQEALNNASRGRTTIMIAHRLSTIRAADRIVLFENGRIVESGTHEELVALGDRYASMVKAQMFERPLASDVEQEVGGSDKFERLGSRQLSRRSYCSQTSFCSEIVYPAAVNSSSSFGIAHVAEDAELAEPIEEEQEEEHGYAEVLRSVADGRLVVVALIGTLFGVVRGTELFWLAQLFTHAFAAFEDDVMMTSRLTNVFIGYATLGVVVLVTQLVSGVCYTRVSEEVCRRLRTACLRNVLHQDASFFDEPAHSASQLITRLATDATNTKAAMDTRMLAVVFALTSISLNVATGYASSWHIALTGSLLLVALAAFTVLLAFRISNMNMKHVRKDHAGKIAIEIIENVKTIQLLTSTERFMRRYKKSIDIQERADWHKTRLEALNAAVSQTYMYFAMFVCYTLAVRLIHHSLVDVETAFRAINSMMMSSVAVVHSSHNFPEFVKAKTAARLLFKLISRRPKSGDLRDGLDRELRGDVLFEHVHFSYPRGARRPVVTDLELSARHGHTVALVGPSGGGKSTCVSLLERFYDVTAGSVTIDGHDIRTLSLFSLRSQMALVGQEPRLFSGTIRENVCFGLKNVPTEKVLKALEVSNADRFVSSLPSGLETQVGEKGSHLSGGQKQRIAIARALVREPKILLLDEATSALDSHSEKAVQEALERARKGRTCITIAHRLSSIQNSDVIYYVEQGGVRESGSHAELMHKRGKYYELIKKQDLAP